MSKSRVLITKGKTKTVHLTRAFSTFSVNNCFAKINQRKNKELSLYLEDKIIYHHKIAFNQHKGKNKSHKIKFILCF